MYIDNHFNDPQMVYGAIANLLKTLAKDHNGISGYENDVNAYVDAYMHTSSSTVNAFIENFMEDFIKVEEMDNHSGKTLFIYQVFANPSKGDKLVHSEKFERLQSAINVANNWSTKEGQYYKLRFFIIDHDADTELYNDEIREKLYEYQLIHRVFNQDGELETDEREYYDAIEEVEKTLDVWLNTSPFDGLTNEIERVLDIRSYQNVEKGIRFELMDTTAHEFLIATRD